MIREAITVLTLDPAEGWALLCPSASCRKRPPVWAPYPPVSKTGKITVVISDSDVFD